MSEVRDKNLPMFDTYTLKCKECGQAFLLQSSEIEEDHVRGLGHQARCRPCRDSKKKRNRYFSMSHMEDSTIPDIRQWSSIQILSRQGFGHVNRGKVSHLLPPSTSAPAAEERHKFRQIDPYVQRILDRIEQPDSEPIYMLIVPTGYGKSTWLPYRLLTSSIGRRGRILMTQPRTITLRAADIGSEDVELQAHDTTLPGYIATRLLRVSPSPDSPSVGPGREIGLLYRGEKDLHDEANRLLFCTDGILLNKMKDGSYSKYGVVIIDEAHEQSLNMEIIFQCIKSEINRGTKTKFVIASATINQAKFVQYFGSDNVFVSKASAEIEARHSVDVVWLKKGDPLLQFDTENDGNIIPSELIGSPDDKRDVLGEAIERIVRTIRLRPSGIDMSGQHREPGCYDDILIFVNSVPTIYRLLEYLSRRLSCDFSNLQFIPLHAKMEDEELASWKASDAKAEEAETLGTKDFQRIFIATNYAETSITFPTLRYVIDTGWCTLPEYDPRSNAMLYRKAFHTQAGLKQRAGRVGRTTSGIVYRLYTEHAFANLAPTDPIPEVQRMPLDSAFLSLAGAGYNVQEADFLGLREAADSSEAKARAVETLVRRGAVSSEGRTKKYALQLSNLSASNTDQRHALQNADRFGCLLEVAVFLVISSTSNFFAKRSNDDARLEFVERTKQQRKFVAVDDLEYFLRLFVEYRSILINDADLLKNEVEERILEWCQRYGVSRRALREVDENLDMYLTPFCKNASAQIADREISVDRLHRARLCLTLSLPDLVYKRVGSEGPYTSLAADVPEDRRDGSVDAVPPNPCKGVEQIGVQEASDTAGEETVEDHEFASCGTLQQEIGPLELAISRASAMFSGRFSTEAELVLALQRQRGRCNGIDIINLDKCISVNPAWLQEPDGSGLLELSEGLRDAFEHDRALSSDEPASTDDPSLAFSYTDSFKRLLSGPALGSLEGYQAGDLIFVNPIEIDPQGLNEKGQLRFIGQYLPVLPPESGSAAVRPLRTEFILDLGDDAEVQIQEIARRARGWWYTPMVIRSVGSFGVVVSFNDVVDRLRRYEGEQVNIVAKANWKDFEWSNAIDRNAVLLGRFDDGTAVPISADVVMLGRLDRSIPDIGELVKLKLVDPSIRDLGSAMSYPTFFSLQDPDPEPGDRLICKITRKDRTLQVRVGRTAHNVFLTQGSTLLKELDAYVQGMPILLSVREFRRREKGAPILVADELDPMDTAIQLASGTLDDLSYDEAAAALCEKLEDLVRQEPYPSMRAELRALEAGLANVDFQKLEDASEVLDRCGRAVSTITEAYRRACGEAIHKGEQMLRRLDDLTPPSQNFRELLDLRKAFEALNVAVWDADEATALVEQFETAFERAKEQANTEFDENLQRREHFLTEFERRLNSTDLPKPNEWQNAGREFFGLRVRPAEHRDTKERWDALSERAKQGRLYDAIARREEQIQRQRGHIAKLQKDIRDSTNSNWIAKAGVWLEDHQTKLEKLQKEVDDIRRQLRDI